METVKLEDGGMTGQAEGVETVGVKKEPEEEDASQAEEPEVLQPTDLVFTNHMCIKVEAEFEEVKPTFAESGSETAACASETALQPSCWPVLTVLPMTEINSLTEQNETQNSSPVDAPAAPPSSGTARHACDMCGKKLVSASKLLVHTRCHNGEKPFPCDRCHKKFVQNSDLQKHYRTHTGEKPYSCSICNKKFAHLNSVKSHERVHSDDKPFLCTLCNTRFAELDKLETHVLKHRWQSHSGKKYTCEFCNREFTGMRGLRRHVLTHTGERPLKCELCEKSFRDLQTLKSHLRSHTGELPYSCEICKKSYTRISSLRNHEWVHLRNGFKQKQKDL